VTVADRARMVLVFSAFVVAGCMGFWAPLSAADAADTKSTAVEIATDGTEYASGTFAVAHQSHEEWFRFRARAGMAYRITQAWDQDAGVQTYLYDSGVEPVSGYWAYGTDQPSSRWYGASVAGEYLYVRQSSGGGASLGSNYTLSVIERPLDEVAATVGGSVLRAPDGAPVFGASVTIRHADPLLEDTVAVTNTGPGGAWSAEVLPGSYVVRFDDPAGLLTGEYYDHLTHVREGVDAPTAVQVPVAGALTSIDGILSVRGRISGRVTSSVDGAGIAGVTVTARSGLGEHTAVTDGEGEFVFEGLDTGWPLQLLAAGLDGWLPVTEATPPFSVAPGGTHAAVLTMQPTGDPAGSIAGRVTDALSGIALVGIDVTLVARESSQTIASALTGADGHYRFDGVSPGIYRVLFADASGLRESAYSDVEVVPGGEAAVDRGLTRIPPPAPLTPTRVSIAANRTTVARGREVVFSGNVTPNQPAGASVVIYVQKRGTHVWKRLARRTLTSRRHWSFRYRPSARGVYYLRATFAGDDTYAKSASSPKRLTVR